jgi:PTS system nitrogen regulatory IIA component
VRQLLAQRVRTQRGVTWAPIGGGFALPHLRTPVALGGNAGTLALLFLNDGLPLEEPPPDGVALTRLFFFIAPSPRVHLEALAKLSAALTRTGLRQLVIQAAADSRIFAELATADGPEVGG